jgi:hypothetical protein
MWFASASISPRDVLGERQAPLDDLFALTLKFNGIFVEIL